MQCECTQSSCSIQLTCQKDQMLAWFYCHSLQKDIGYFDIWFLLLQREAAVLRCRKSTEFCLWTEARVKEIGPCGRFLCSLPGDGRGVVLWEDSRCGFWHIDFRELLKSMVSCMCGELSCGFFPVTDISEVAELGFKIYHPLVFLCHLVHLFHANLLGL